MAVRPLPATRAASVVVSTPSGTRTRVAIHPTPFHIGRQSENQLVIRDNRASRTHARIEVENGEYFILDLKSSHGTFVNGARVTRHKLHASDRIEFGFPDSYTLLFTYDDDELNRILEQFPAPQTTNVGLSGNLQKLRALVEVARALQNSLAIEDVLAAVVEAALAITGCERGFLLLNKDGKLEVSVARDRFTGNVGKDALDVAPETLFDALLHRRELLSMTFNPQSAELSNQTLHGADLRSVVCIPLVRIRPGGNGQETCIVTSNTDTVGVLYLDARQTTVDLSSGNRELLQTLALEASTVLENARLLEEERARQRLEEELSIAREIQSSLLPRKLPSGGWFRAAGWSMPSHAVGGDCFDVRQIGSEAWSAVITDVSGKGVSSALLAALLQGSFLTGSGDIAAQMSRINSFLYERTEGEKYATVFYCILRQDGSMTWSNAGHVTPYLLRATGEVQPLPTTGMPLGMLDIAEFGVETLQLNAGDRILAYSDGLTEAENRKGEFYGTKRLTSLLQKGSHLPASGLLSAIVADISYYTGGASQSDDVTLLVVEYNPAVDTIPPTK